MIPKCFAMGTGIAATTGSSRAANVGEPVVITNSFGVKLVLIPAGEFQMGSC